MPPNISVRDLTKVYDLGEIQVQTDMIKTRVLRWAATDFHGYVCVAIRARVP